MSNRTLLFLVVLVLISVGILTVMNIFNIQTGSLETPFISANDVKAVEVYSKEKAYPLSFEQQKRFVDIINHAVRTGFEKDLTVIKTDFDYDKIVIHQVEGEEITATPYGLINSQLLLKIPEWNPDGLIRETGPGELNKLFSSVVAQ